MPSTVERWEPAVPFLGGFGFGAAVVLASFWSAWPYVFLAGWPLGALLSGLIYPRNRRPAFAGFAAAGIVFWLLYLNLYPFVESGSELSGIGDIIIWIVYAAILAVAAGAVRLGASLASNMRTNRGLRNASAAVGAIAVLLAALTAVQLTVSPF